MSGFGVRQLHKARKGRIVQLQAQEEAAHHRPGLEPLRFHPKRPLSFSHVLARYIPCLAWEG